MEVSRKAVRTRMAPSPTGNLHIGTAYATMWPYIYARHNGGVFILRMEDTDQQRSTKEFEDNIINGLKSLGFDWDEGPFHQMDRLEVYKKYAHKLLDEDKAYFCFCTPEELELEKKDQAVLKLPQIYSGKCRSLTKEEIDAYIEVGRKPVIRFKLNTEEMITFNDVLHGDVTFDPKVLGDMVIMRSTGIPLYNFAVVVDDIEMKITDVVRGDDHISNTPKQVMIFRALGEKPPVYAHFPMILNQDRSGKLSKRTGSTSVQDFLHEGYLPEVLFNYIALLGWHPKGDVEIFSKEELIKNYNIDDMNSSAAAWNQPKLDWMNGEYIRLMTDDELTKRLTDYLIDHPAKDKIASIVPLIKERIKKLSDFIPLTNFFFEEVEYDMAVFDEIKVEYKAALLEKSLKTFKDLSSPWKLEEYEEAFRNLAKDEGIGNREMFQLLRIAISGQLVTPPLYESMQILGEDKVLIRIENAINFLRNK